MYWWQLNLLQNILDRFSTKVFVHMTVPSKSSWWGKLHQGKKQGGGNSGKQRKALLEIIFD